MVLRLDVLMMVMMMEMMMVIMRWRIRSLHLVLGPGLLTRLILAAPTHLEHHDYDDDGGDQKNEKGGSLLQQKKTAPLA